MRRYVIKLKDGCKTFSSIVEAENIWIANRIARNNLDRFLHSLESRDEFVIDEVYSEPIEPKFTPRRLGKFKPSK